MWASRTTTSLRIQQTQASQSEHAADAMETEAGAAVEDMNAHLLIIEEGPAAQSSAVAPPPDDEVTHLWECHMHLQTRVRNLTNLSIDILRPSRALFCELP